MPHFTPAPSDLNDPAANAQRAAFIAVLAEMGREWGRHTTSILGFTGVLYDSENAFDAETRQEMRGLVVTEAQRLRRLNHVVRFAAQLLSGSSIPFNSASLDLHELMGRVIAHDFGGFGKAPQIIWGDTKIHVKADEKQWFAMLSALMRHGLLLTRNRLQNALQIGVKQNDDALLFIFSGDTNPAYFTDPDEWFTIDPKRGSDSVRLLVARELARRHGGRVWVETANKTRFDFRLSLPAVQEAANE